MYVNLFITLQAGTACTYLPKFISSSADYRLKSVRFENMASARLRKISQLLLSIDLHERYIGAIKSWRERKSIGVRQEHAWNKTSRHSYIPTVVCHVARGRLPRLLSRGIDLRLLQNIKLCAGRKCTQSSIPNAMVECREQGACKALLRNSHFLLL